MEVPIPSEEFPRRLSRLQSFGVTDCADPLIKMSRRGRFGPRLGGVGLVEQCHVKLDRWSASSGLPHRLISRNLTPICEVPTLLMVPTYCP